MKPRDPVFSLAHATARLPTGWQPAARAWREHADNPASLEYILCVHESDIHRLPLTERALADKVVINHGPSTSVANWNEAARAATGSVLITVADDWFPPEHWDSHLLSVIPDPKKPAAVWVSTGDNDSLMQFSILTRPYYEKYGRIFYPEYIGMFADDDFQAQSSKDGILLDCRKTLPIFEHRHPAYGKGQEDDVYRWQNRKESYDVGRAVLERRRASNFA